MKYAKVELHVGYFDGRTVLGRRLKKSGAKVRKHYDITFMTVNADERTLLDDVIRDLRPQAMIIRGLDDELKAALTHGGHVQSWAVVYKALDNMDQLDAAVDHMVETVRKRESATLKASSPNPVRGEQQREAEREAVVAANTVGSSTPHIQIVGSHKDRITIEVTGKGAGWLADVCRWRNPSAPRAPRNIVLQAFSDGLERTARELRQWDGNEGDKS